MRDITRSAASTPRRPRRGDIHSSLPMSSPSLARRAALGQPHNPNNLFGSQGSSHFGSDGLAGPDMSTGGMSFSQANSERSDIDARPEEDENGNVKFIWGTTISLNESMKIFKDFLRNFKPKYRAAYNKNLRAAHMEQEDPNSVGLPVPMNPLYDNLSTLKANTPLYVTYLRTMRKTQQNNLNLDSLNLLSYPPSRKIYHQLLSYPQEIIPIMDACLKDLMIEITEEELEHIGAGDYLERAVLQEDLADMGGRVFKVRPFGGEKNVNMRDLNPGGQ